jgi:hypothetical protein
MLLGFLTVAIMLAVGYAYLREGVFTAFCMFFNVFVAGLMAFNFWEPLADLLDAPFAGSFLHGYEDLLCLVALFGVTLGGLRTITNAIARSQLKYPGWLRQLGGVLFGLSTGYLVAGFLLCTLQTLPWHENFMNFEPHLDEEGGGGMRRIMPPDRVWLALMHKAGAYAFANNEDPDPQFAEQQSAYARYLTFDKYGNFSLRYARHRRYNEVREALMHQGEFERQLGRMQ